MVGIISTRAQAPVPDFSASTTAGCGPLGVTFKDLSTNSPLFWTWDFGNGQTSALQNPTTTYTIPGTYTVTLIAKNRSGADAIRKTDYITVFPYPTANFTSNLSLVCAPTNVQFTDQSTPGQGSITSYAWDLGDGAVSNQPNPSHTYTTPGYYNVTLKVTNSGGCSNTAGRARYLRVVDGIQANFTWDQTSAACSAPYVLNFINQTAGPGNLTYSWNLGNGANPAASSDTSPANINYPATGNYDVTLQVNSSLGCSGSITQTVPLSATNATITSPDQLCVNTPVTFTNGSTPTPVSASWDFGDGTVSTDINPSKSYTANGTYTVTLTNHYASCTGTATKVITVGNPPAPSFAVDKTSSCSAPFTVQFTDKTNPAPVKWLWDFGDGQTSTAQNPSHTYTTTGHFDLKLTTTDAGGCSNTTTLSQFINIAPPSINGLTGTLGACDRGANTDVTPIANIDAPDGVQSYSWSAPGATPSSSTSATPTFTYPGTGQYGLTLTITTNGGCTKTATFNNTVNIGTHAVPLLDINPNPVCGRDPVTFKDDEPITPGTEGDYTWIWTFGDGNNLTTSVPTATHSYFNVAKKDVVLTVFHNGCPTSVVPATPFRVNPPIVYWDYKPDCPNTNNATVNVLFTDTSGSREYGNPPFSAVWNFGDGTPNGSVGVINGAITHSYTLPNPAGLNYFDVTLTVSDGGCTQSLKKSIVIGKVNFDFTIPLPLMCSGVDINLNATSRNPELISGYYWHWDNDPPQPYVFTSSPSTTLRSLVRGNHTITLVIQLANGCTDSISHPVQISYPEAHFTPPPGACKNAPVTLTDESTPDPATSQPVSIWSWDFGDGTAPVTDKNPTHNYTDTGLYTVTLFIRDGSGCSRTYIAPAPIHITSPNASFNGPDSFYCPKTPLTFKDLSTGVSLTDSWNYGDGQPADATGIHAFDNNQTYTVTLTVTDANGCTSSTTKPVRIQAPIAAFDISDTTAICTPLQTKFVAHGQFYDSLYWDFGDGSTSNRPTTSHFYNTLGIDTAKLFVRGPGGCLDSASRRVMLFDPVTNTRFNYPNNPAQCDSVPIQFDIAPPDYTKFTLVFGDSYADSSQNQQPFHIYRNPGAYTPTVVLLDATGCIVNVGTLHGAITVLGSVPFISLDPHDYCDKGTVVFTDYTITNDGIASETLTFGDGTSENHNTGSADFNTEHFYDHPGTFLAKLTVTTNSTCTETYTDTVHIHQTPHPVIAISSTLCTGVVTFAGSLTTAQTDSVSWAWDLGNGQTAKAQNVSGTFKPGPYNVKLKTSIPFGCSDTTSASIVVNPLPEIKGPAEISTPVGFPIAIPFTYSSNVNTWVWSPTDHLDCSNCANPTATLIFKEQYTVTVTDANSCSNSANILIKTICNDKNYFLPNTFSPNGDGVNDYFYPRGTSIYNIQSLRVFNRWGQMVFERKNFPANAQNMGWDGNFNGRPAPADAYVYIAEVICENAEVVALHGDVTLIR